MAMYKHSICCEAEGVRSRRNEDVRLNEESAERGGES